MGEEGNMGIEEEWRTRKYSFFSKFKSLGYSFWKKKECLKEVVKIPGKR